MKTRNSYRCDVVVCGGGCAGLVAALAAARNNVRTLLIERAGFAGGIITAVGLPYFDGIADKATGRIVVRGIPFELLVKMGRCRPDATHVQPHNPTLDSIERFKLLADQLLLAHGEMVGVLYHTAACDVVVRRGRADKVVVSNKDGLVEIQARQVIDCTGDGDIAAWAMFEAWKEAVPGFEKAYFITSGPYIGIRETRRLRGQYVLSEQDIFEQRRFSDAIATGCWYLDRHPNRTTVGTANEPGEGGGDQPKPYDIPYRSLVARKVDNLLVAGRCHSATAAAASSTRVTVTAMALGQAAGTAAALAVKRRTSVAELDGQQVREELVAQGAGPLTEE